MLDFHFPSYDVVGYEEIKVNNHLRQGYDITKTVRFKKPFNFSIYEFIDSLCYEPETRWETEQYELSYEKLVKEYVDKWGEDSLYLYVNKWDSIAKDKSKKVPNKYFYVGHLFQLQFNKKSGLVLIKYFDYQ